MIKSSVPWPTRSLGKLGSAANGRPISSANRAVIIEPLRRDASTTKTPCEALAIKRLRASKRNLRTASKGAYALTNTPPASRTGLTHSRKSCGNKQPSPLGKNTTVGFFARIAARCAA
jgi:hypothetical protein